MSLTGELDLLSAGWIRVPFQELASDGRPQIVVDLAGLTFIDTSGIHALLDLDGDAREAGKRLRLAAVSEKVRRVFELAGVTDRFAWDTTSGASAPESRDPP
jgi:anti-anti-sigma factor